MIEILTYSSRSDSQAERRSGPGAVAGEVGVGIGVWVVLARFGDCGLAAAFVVDAWG